MPKYVHDAYCLAASDLVNAILGDDDNRPEPPCTCRERQEARKKLRKERGGSESTFGISEGQSLGNGNFIKPIARSGYG